MKNKHTIWYHGSDCKINLFNPYSFDLGNTFQNAGWSTFCFKDYEYTKKFTIMRCIQRYYDTIKNEDNKSFLHNNRCTWDFINEKPITTNTGLDYILKNIVGREIFIHWIDSSILHQKGIGNDITHDEFTFRDTNIYPIKIETITLTKEELIKYIMVVNDVNLYRDKLVELSKFYNRGILSLFIIYDYTLNRREIEKIIIATSEEKLKVGQNLQQFIIDNHINIKKIPLLKRLIKCLLGMMNKKIFVRVYIKKLKNYNDKLKMK